MPIGANRLRSYHSWTRHALMTMCVLLALAGCSSSDEPSAEDLLGTWNASFGPAWQIEAERVRVTGGAVTSFGYAATDTTIEADDTGCPTGATGTYEWQIEEDVLTLTVVEDDCDGRRDSWNGATFDRAN